MTGLRAIAAVLLRVPDSGLPWLDAMIERARRDEFAKAAMQGVWGGPTIKKVEEVRGAMRADEAISDTAYAQADAMLAQGRKG